MPWTGNLSQKTHVQLLQVLFTLMGRANVYLFIRSGISCRRNSRDAAASSVRDLTSVNKRKLSNLKDKYEKQLYYSPLGVKLNKGGRG